MEDPQLTEEEHDLYGETFNCFRKDPDIDEVPIAKVSQLVRTTHIPRRIAKKVMEICGTTKGSSHVNRKQFYSILKLIAAYQHGLEITPDLLSSSLKLDLPSFYWPYGAVLAAGKNEDVLSSTSESESEVESPREKGCSTDSPTPTNSVIQERGELAMGGETILDSTGSGWQGLLVSEEQRQLLGTEEESSERHSSDDGDGDGEGSSFPPKRVWVINKEQREYYSAQFAQLQPDPEGLVAGSVARTFFEKSKLPVAELRRIWQLADVTRDGALSLQEFYAAMHLVVLRRHHVPLPDVLPPTLAPPMPASAPDPAPVPAPLPLPVQVTAPVPVSAVPKPPHPSPPNNTKEKSKAWTKFVDSPTGTSGSLASPGPKLVNFDFQKAAVERDPKILHPVPLRLTPEASVLASSGGSNNSNGSTLGDDENQASSITLVQRPQAKKPISAPEETIISTPKKEPPPPPPPRPYRTHARSSSLDLNKLGKNGQNFLGAPPLVPPRVSPGITSPKKLVGQKSEVENQKTDSQKKGFVADFSHFSSRSESSHNKDNSQTQQFAGICGAFQIYRKPSPKREGVEDDGTREEGSEETRLTLQELREKNAELKLVCEELTVELAAVLQEKINLRAKLLQT
ncbi:ralBP1-associated Eps domain-containing protein 2 isoform X1 [Neodiprion virginianus]|uniref:ralBP1-associated Eps domain-containing protein 2 isoform X1 n=1 Tax=Neodiprion virginianus TaxID=2961670 RepID=UPI001EE6D3E9|nr:ralBP1-associated Eps domain-containing protein 2 isoform X1 [Neodiprion virginianus]